MSYVNVAQFIYDQQDNAAIWLRQAANNNNAEAQLYLGSIYCEKNQSIKAEKWYKKAKSSDDGFILNSIGTFYFKRGMSKDAEKMFKIAAEKGNKEGLTNLGYLYLCQTRYKEAEISLKIALSKYKNDPRIQSILGQLYYKKKDFPRAEKWLKKAAKNGHHTSKILLKKWKNFNKENIKGNVFKF